MRERLSLPITDAMCPSKPRFLKYALWVLIKNTILDYVFCTEETTYFFS